MSTRDPAADQAVPRPPLRRDLIYTQESPSSGISQAQVLDQQAKAKAERRAKLLAFRARVRAKHLRTTCCG